LEKKSVQISGISGKGLKILCMVATGLNNSVATMQRDSKPLAVIGTDLQKTYL
jgi:hypothetical protein